MSTFTIRHAVLSDLEAVTALEQICFPSSEAADSRAFSTRLHSFPECFWIAESDGNIVSMINGMTSDHPDLTDEMYEDTALYSPYGKWLMLFGVASSPSHQKQGIASYIMNYVIGQMKQQNRFGIVLTCKEGLIPFYQRFGFISEGVSDSVHGGSIWYQMRLDFMNQIQGKV